MGLADTFGKEDRVDITVTQLEQLLKRSVSIEFIKRGIVNRVPYDIIETMVFGADVPEPKVDSIIDPSLLNGVKSGDSDV